MRAARYYGPGEMRVEDVPEPVVKEGQVKIKPLTYSDSPVCGSDVHSYFSLTPVSPTATMPHPVTKETLPITLGHEFSGTICELGPATDSSKLAIGQHVVVEPVISCMKPTCGPCSAGSRNICPNATFIGVGGGGGGLAEYITVQEDYVHVLPPTISLEVGAMMEPLSVAWHAVKRSTFVSGDTALIIGAGPIGLLILTVLRAHGASWIGISEPALSRRETALRLAATAVYDPRAVDVAAGTFRATSGGAAVVFDCAGTQASLDTALAAARPRGNVVEVAVWDKPPVLDITALQSKEVLLTASQACDREHPELIKAVADGRITGLEELITKRIDLGDFVEQGIKALIEDKDRQIKILVHP
ncbi:GroES-like protein [Wolfiporia cocos MD-104 SS10]|uniref:GroES-like protein n=1 Tax=Wolfiporia cocos (strain MD-104) TaxID=742152 RepID=A0A2H3J540_WOLCO|nr:GroES-like protein [Wolfiporia cocos MD-104 SS10]